MRFSPDASVGARSVSDGLARPVAHAPGSDGHTRSAGAPAMPPPDPTKPVELGRPIDPPCQLTRLRFRPDGRVLAAAGCDGRVRRWDTSADAPADLPPLDGHNGWVSGLAFSAAALFTTDSWGRLTARDPDGQQLWTVEAAHDGWARSVAVTADGTLLVTGGRDGFVRF